MRVALVTDGGSVQDRAINQNIYEAAFTFCNSNGYDFSYYQPSSDNTVARVEMIRQSVADGYNVILLAGYTFGEAISEVQNENDEIMFIGLDVTESDLGGSTPGSNVFCSTYQEELSGFLAGYAAVCQGYRHLGFLGGMAVPSVVRYGFGFVQGCNLAATDLGIASQVVVEYAYGNQFYGDANITAYMDNWYQELGVEVVFACGGGIYTSVAEAAQKANGKIIGVDTDQAAIIDDLYGEGITVTSAVKGIGTTVTRILQEIAAGHFSDYAGKVVNLGIVSDDPDFNYVQLAPSTHFSASFTQEDYQALLSRIASGQITVSSDVDNMPSVTILVHEQTFVHSGGEIEESDEGEVTEFIPETGIENESLRIALITDCGSYYDLEYNQLVFEAMQEFSEENHTAYACYQPAADSTSNRVGMIRRAVADGYNVILMPGYIFGEAISVVQNEYSDII